jgi:hypothetical protein
VLNPEDTDEAQASLLKIPVAVNDMAKILT